MILGGLLEGHSEIGKLRPHRHTPHFLKLALANNFEMEGTTIMYTMGSSSLLRNIGKEKFISDRNWKEREYH